MTHVDISSFASKTNLASLKTEIDKIDADKLNTAPVDLVKLNNVVKNDVVEKTEYNSLKTKVDSIDTTNFVVKTKHEKDISDLEDKISKIDKKISDVSSLVKKTDFNSKINEVESEISSFIALATNSAYSMAADVFKARLVAQTDLLRKTDLNFKLKDISARVTKHKTKY